MNMHVPNSIQTRVELENLTLVPTQIISPATSCPIIVIVQDTLLGSYLFTKNEVKIGEYEFNNLMMFNKMFDNKRQKYRNGQQIFSKILPDLSIKGKSENGKYEIVNGRMINGILDKKIINNDLIRTIQNMYGNKDCQVFLDSIQYLITRWLTTRSFSIGFGDTIPSKIIRDKVRITINNAINNVYELIKKVDKGDYYENISEDLRCVLF